MSEYANRLTVIPVPFDLGAGIRGAAEGPDAMRRSGLDACVNRLAAHTAIHDAVRVLGPSAAEHSETADADAPGIRHADAVAAVNRELADAVRRVAADRRFPLVLGGDHSIAIGSLAGLSAAYNRLGVIWFDAHSDLNTPDTSPSANAHGMSLAVALGLGDERLTSIRGSRPPVDPANVVLIGARSLDDGEKSRIRELGITCYTMHDIDRKGMARIMEESIERLRDRTDGVHVSFDVDSLDPAEAPGTGTPVQGGLSYREAHLALELLHESGLPTSAELVELNPRLDPDGRTARLAVELIGSLLGETIL